MPGKDICDQGGRTEMKISGSLAGKGPVK